MRVASTLLVASATLCAVGSVQALDGEGGRLGLLGGRDPRVFYAAAVSQRVVALTLDDGPDAQTTPAILDVLRRYGARATFFVLGERIPGNETLLREVVAAGHELGNHMTRDEPSIDLSAEAFERELLRASAALAPFGASTWFRPGSGYYDSAMLDILDDHGMRCALGLAYAFDAQVPWSWLSSVWLRWRSRPGAVVILHDGGGRGLRTVKTLERLLSALQQRGYRVVTLTELVQIEEREARTAAGAPS